LKENDASAVIHLVTVGGADAEPIIRKALALGGDEAIRVNTEPREAYQVAFQIAEVAKQGGYDMIFTGKETIDFNDGVVGGMIAELLDLPYVAQITDFQLNGSTAVIKREIEGGEETVEVPLPLVVSTQKGVAEARIPNMRGIMSARTKPLKVVEPAAVDTLTSFTQFGLPPAKAGVKLVSADNVEELVTLLREDARAI
jgi:electron transfer flavoprotein beta subunit